MMLIFSLAWALAVGWVIVACVKGAGGPVNTLLSWRAWQPLARMSYCMYLVHITVIDYYLSLPSYTVTVSHLQVIYFFIWIIFVSALIAFIAVIAFDMPLAHVEKMLWASAGLGIFPAVQKRKENGGTSNS